MIARPGRPGIHDGTEFALQGFKNPVGEAAAIAFSNSSRDNFDGGVPLRTSIWGKDTTEFASAFLNGGASAIHRRPLPWNFLWREPIGDAAHAP